MENTKISSEQEWIKLRNENIDVLDKYVQWTPLMTHPDKQDFIVWYHYAFTLKNNPPEENYFKEWVGRYNRGTATFLAYMDEERREIFKEVFLK